MKGKVIISLQELNEELEKLNLSLQEHLVFSVLVSPAEKNRLRNWAKKNFLWRQSFCLICWRMKFTDMVDARVHDAQVERIGNRR